MVSFAIERAPKQESRESSNIVDLPPGKKFRQAQPVAKQCFVPQYGFHLPTVFNPKLQRITDSMLQYQDGSMLTAFAFFQVNAIGVPKLITSFDSAEQLENAIPQHLQKDVTKRLQDAAAAITNLRNHSSSYRVDTLPESTPSDCGSLDFGDASPPASPQSRYGGAKRGSQSDLMPHSSPKRMRLFRDKSSEKESWAWKSDLAPAEEDPPGREVSRDRYHTLSLANKEEMTKYLRGLLESIKQLSLKAILKAWILAICPHKQKQFPYVESNEEWKKNHNKENETPRRPSWWPIEHCEHREPDHLKKAERMILAMVIIRLRDRKVMDWEKKAPNGYPSWTSMLANSTKEVDFKHGPNDTPQDVETRKQLLVHFYHVARLEEDFVNGRQDGTSCILMKTIEVRRRCGRRAGTKIVRKAVRSTKVSATIEEDELAGQFPTCTAGEETFTDGWKTWEVQAYQGNVTDAVLFGHERAETNGRASSPSTYDAARTILACSEKAHNFATSNQMAENQSQKSIHTQQHREYFLQPAMGLMLEQSKPTLYNSDIKVEAHVETNYDIGTFYSQQLESPSHNTYTASLAGVAELDAQYIPDMPVSGHSSYAPLPAHFSAMDLKGETSMGPFQDKANMPLNGFASHPAMQQHPTHFDRWPPIQQSATHLWEDRSDIPITSTTCAVADMEQGMENGLPIYGHVGLWETEGSLMLPPAEPHNASLSRFVPR
ncbi:MAG: hypothetical protein M1822_010205 [Bathelium mastoideum]|nr:MAG: hypothetical protein M1822_010205 [Bathelium mastoideum]